MEVLAQIQEEFSSKFPHVKLSKNDYCRFFHAGEYLPSSFPYHLKLDVEENYGCAGTLAGFQGILGF